MERKVKTYRDLLEALHLLTPSQLDCNLTVYDNQMDEYFPAIFAIAKDDGVLDQNHPVFVTHAELTPIRWDNK